MDAFRSPEAAGCLVEPARFHFVAGRFGIILLHTIDGDDLTCRDGRGESQRRIEGSPARLVTDLVREDDLANLGGSVTGNTDIEPAGGLPFAKLGLKKGGGSCGCDFADSGDDQRNSFFRVTIERKYLARRVSLKSKSLDERRSLSGKSKNEGFYRIRLRDAAAIKEQMVILTQTRDLLSQCLGMQDDPVATLANEGQDASPAEALDEVS